MIHIPQDWRDKIVHGLNIFSHIDQLHKQRKKLAVAVRMWAGALVISLIAHSLGVWSLLVGHISSFVQRMLPNAVLVLQPVNMSNQFIYLCSWVVVPIVVRAILSGARRTTKSWAWYFVRFLLASLWIGIATGLAISIASVAIQWGSGIQFAVGNGRLFGQVICPGIGVLLLWLIALYMTRAALTGLTFGAAFLLQGKKLVDSYLRGARLFNTHWPYVMGVLFYFFALNAIVQVVVVPAVPANSFWAIIAGGLSYALWPLYWGIILPYHKMAARRR